MKQTMWAVMVLALVACGQGGGTESKDNGLAPEAMRDWIKGMRTEALEVQSPMLIYTPWALEDKGVDVSIDETLHYETPERFISEVRKYKYAPSCARETTMILHPKPLSELDLSVLDEKHKTNYERKREWEEDYEGPPKLGPPWVGAWAEVRIKLLFSDYETQAGFHTGTNVGAKFSDREVAISHWYVYTGPKTKGFDFSRHYKKHWPSDSPRYNREHWKLYRSTVEKVTSVAGVCNFDGRKIPWMFEKGRALSPNELVGRDQFAARWFQTGEGDEVMLDFPVPWEHVAPEPGSAKPMNKGKDGYNVRNSMANGTWKMQAKVAEVLDGGIVRLAQAADGEPLLRVLQVSNSINRLMTEKQKEQYQSEYVRFAPRGGAETVDVRISNVHVREGVRLLNGKGMTATEALNNLFAGREVTVWCVAVDLDGRPNCSIRGELADGTYTDMGVLLISNGLAWIDNMRGVHKYYKQEYEAAVVKAEKDMLHMLPEPRWTH